MESVQLGRGDTDFIRKVEAESHQKVSKCYQCGNCTAGCPMAFTYDYSVSQIMRLIQLGQREAVLGCKSLWMCATCETCTTRCPNNIEVAKVMDVCRNMARREGFKGVRAVRLFTDSFLQSVRWNGRSHELGLMAMYKLRSGNLFADMDLAPPMLLKNKLPILPHRIKQTGEVADIFSRYAERLEREKGDE